MTNYSLFSVYGQNGKYFIYNNREGITYGPMFRKKQDCQKFVNKLNNNTKDVYFAGGNVKLKK